GSSHLFMDKLYILPLTNIVLFPGNIVGLVINDEKLANNITHNWRFISLLVKDDKYNFYDYGCLCEVISVQKLYANTFIIQLKAFKRVKVFEINFEDIYPFSFNFKVLEEKKVIENENEIKTKLLNTAKNYIGILNINSYYEAIYKKDLCVLTDLIASIIRIKPVIKQELLAQEDCIKRAYRLIELIEEILKRWPAKNIILNNFINKPLVYTFYFN
ncbi:MAG: LON peptidase substrate-binding domain-containing protein, partial [bacterium]